MLTIAKIEDHEGDGRCSACSREGLRWVATLSDGTTVGLECAKKAVGFKPSPIEYSWIGDYEIVAEHIEYGQTYVMWQRKGRAQTRETRNGVTVAVGGVRARWVADGWL